MAFTRRAALSRLEETLGRVEFVQKTKRIIAARSGYRCSIPSCNRVTVGPGATASEVATTGVAAHIFSASAGGPRGQGGLTAEELCEAQNGVWVCADHARLIDANRGDQYSAALLLSYKHLQEARTAREQRGIHAPFRWLHELKLIRSPLTSSVQRLLFGKLNLVVGPNDSGKTALCQWVSAFSTLEWITRWRSGDPMRFPIIAELSYFDPEPHMVVVSIGHDGSLGYRLDGAAVPLSPLPMRVVFPQSRQFTDTRGLDDLQLISKLLSLDSAIVQNLAAEVNEAYESSVRNLRFVREGDDIQLRVDAEGTVPNVSFHNLSGSEQDRVLMEFAIGLCRIVGRHQPTLLILDPCFASLDKTWFERYGTRLSKPEHPFQTIAVIPTREFDAARLRWLGWEIVRTSGKPPSITVDQSIPWSSPQDRDGAA